MFSATVDGTEPNLNPTSPINGPKKITTKAVVDYALKLRDEADRQTLIDPYHTGYRPTESYARKLSGQLGPEAAIDQLRKRAAMHKRDERMAATIASASLERHKGRHRKHRETREKQRGHLSAGTRIDGAIARLALIAAPSGAQIGQSVHGGTRDQTPAFCVDAADKARRLALACARQIEDLEDECKVRDLNQVAA